MNAFMQWMETHFMPMAAKIGSQRHLIAIRDGFIAIMPVTMVGSIAVLLNVFLRDLPNEWLGEGNGFVAAMDPIIAINGNVYFGSITVLGIAFTISLGYHLSKSYDVNPIAGAVIAFSAVVTCMNQNAVFNYILNGVDLSSLDSLKAAGLDVIESEGAVALQNVSGWGYMGEAYTGSSGLFTCLIVGLLSTMIYVKLMQKKVTIKLPDSVPPAVSNAFAAIIPGIVAIYVFGILTQISVQFTGLYPNDLIVEWIQKPLLGLSQGLGSVVLMMFLIQLFWFFGLHGDNILAPVTEGIYTPALLENLRIWNETQSTADMPYIWTRGSINAYAMAGGSGMTLALLIAIFIVSKKKDSREIAKLALPMGVFNINEPEIFGIPIVLNPVYLIPWLITAPVCSVIGYVFKAAHIIPPVYIQVPWVMPVGLYAFFGTGGSVMAGVVSLICLAVAVLIWVPFVMLANRMENKQ